MHAVRVAFIFASHLLSLALAVYTTRTSGVPVVILFYAFIIEYVFRLVTIQVLHADLSRSRGLVHAIAPHISRRPRPGQQSHPVRDGEGGPPGSFLQYLIPMVVCGFFAFMLMHVNSPDGELAITADAGVRYLGWAVLIGAIYWLNSLLTRTIVIHPGEPLTQNFGYNSNEVAILAFAVLTGAVVVVVRQNMGVPASGWTVMGPMLFFRFLFDLWGSLDALDTGGYPRGEEKLTGG